MEQVLYRSKTKKTDIHDVLKSRENHQFFAEMGLTFPSPAIIMDTRLVSGYRFWKTGEPVIRGESLDFEV